jgi:hypothetical protein
MSPMLFLCVCDREWCYCTNRVMTQNAPCYMCLEGAHQEAPDPIRPPATDDEPWYPPAPTKPSLRPGCYPTITTMVAVAGPLLFMGVAAWVVVASLVWLASKVIR